MQSSFKGVVVPSLLVALAVSVARADEAPPQGSSETALRESLNFQSGDDYDRALLSDSVKAAANTKSDKIRDLDQKLNRELGAAASREDEQKDKLAQAIQGMRDVQTRLAHGNSDAVTQHVQRQVVADLQQIVDEAKKSGKCLGRPLAANRNKPSKPGVDPNAQARTNVANDQPAGESDPNARQRPKQPPAERAAIARDTMKQQYLELQSRQRDTMLEWPSEYFLPEYERDIEDYFRRLSSGKSTDDRPTMERQ